MLLPFLVFLLPFYNLEVVRVVDGDTIVVNMDNVPKVFGENLSIRFKGIDTAEMNSKDSCEREMARIHKQYLTDLLLAKDGSFKKVNLVEVERGKYFRLVAEVYVGGQNINNLMLEQPGVSRYGDPFVCPYK